MLLRDSPVDQLPMQTRRIIETVIDRREVGHNMDDVTLSQRTLQAALVDVDEDGGAPWGWSIRNIQRGIAEAVELGWLSVEDVDIENSGWQMNRYRFHVPEQLQSLWNDILARGAAEPDQVDELEGRSKPRRGGGKRVGDPRGRKPPGDRRPPSGRIPHAGPGTFVGGLIAEGKDEAEIRAEITAQYHGHPARRAEALAALSANLPGG
jgi:hypothetical protein